MTDDQGTDCMRERPLYERPCVRRVVVRTTREHLGWQYGEAGSHCTGHNHDSEHSGCAYPR